MRETKRDWKLFIGRETEGEMMSEPKLNKALIRKMIKHYERAPESYDQGDYGRRWTKHENRPAPLCGAVACLAGTAIIQDSKNLKAGVARLMRTIGNSTTRETATRLMGIKDYGYYGSIFEQEANSWPVRFRSQFRAATTYKGEARAAINLLKAILKTDGKILESE